MSLRTSAHTGVAISGNNREIPTSGSALLAMTILIDNFAFCALRKVHDYIFQFVIYYYSRGILTYGFHS